jgi:hypothetical protein
LNTSRTTSAFHGYSPSTGFFIQSVRVSNNQCRENVLYSKGSIDRRKVPPYSEDVVAGYHGFNDGHPASNLTFLRASSRRSSTRGKANPALWADSTIFIIEDKDGGCYDSSCVQFREWDFDSLILARNHQMPSHLTISSEMLRSRVLPTATMDQSHCDRAAIFPNRTPMSSWTAPNIRTASLPLSIPER